MGGLHGMPGYIGPMTVSYPRGPVYDFHEQRNMSGYSEIGRVILPGRGIGVATGTVAVPH